MVEGCRTCISDVGAVLQAEGVQVGQAWQHGPQAGVPQVVTVTQVQALQALQARQAAGPRVCDLRTPAHAQPKHTLSATIASGGLALLVVE